MVNMIKMNVNRIITITKGTLVRHGNKVPPVLLVSTDTREIVPGAMFIALTGKKYDGHDFLSQALEQGARVVCISDDTKLVDGDYTAILVPDTLKAYQAIAAAFREEAGFTVVGVTGSVGKTSTREMIAAALSGGMKVHQTRENFNNEIGLPKTLLETPDDADACVVEMGMRGPGEIRELTMIARPDIAVITNIGISHIERLGNQDEIFKAKTEIVEGLKTDGLLIVNGNDPYLSMYCNRVSHQYRTAAVILENEIPINADFVVRGFHLQQTAESVTFQVEIKSYLGIPVLLDSVTIPVPGAHNVINALIGIAVAVEMGMNLQDVVKGLTSYKSIGNRQRILTHRNMTIIDDSYNAGLESVRSALAMLSDIAGKNRKIAVLGGMLELGDYTAYAHEEIGKTCVAQKIDLVFACGEEAKSIQDGVNQALMESEVSNIRVFHFNTRDELIPELCKTVQKDDVILIKGSRAFGMEKVTEALLAMKE